MLPRPFALAASLLAPLSVFAQPIVEQLDRGVIATPQPDGSVFVSWRLLASDAPDTAFNVYRTTAAGEAQDWGAFRSRNDLVAGTHKVNGKPLTGPTWFVDHAPALERATTYTVRRVVNGQEVSDDDAGFALAANVLPLPYHRIPLQTPEGYTPVEASPADLDGDGRLELVVKQERGGQDNSRPGVTPPVFLQAYELDGTLLWQIDLGHNIRAGAHYTQFMVYDFDSDGVAELVCKTADGTVDGKGQVIGDASARWANEKGYIIRGPEFLTLFDGRTGQALDTVDYVPGRHPTEKDPTPEQIAEIWGDGYGNRLDRFLATVAYLDGEHPSVVMCRGYYTRAVLAAWDVKKGKLMPRWVFDSREQPAYSGQGNHSLASADVDGDGKQEIVYGAMVVDDNGAGLYSTGWGHGDAHHVSDLVPSNPGLEIFSIQERFDKQGMNLRDAQTGKPLLLVPSAKAADSGGDKGEGPGRGVAFNIDPRWPGAEMWAAGAGMNGVYNAAGERIMDTPRGMPCNFAVWWDGDLQRELLDQNFITKWNWETGYLDPLLIAHGATSSNSTKATPVLSGDLIGDWREEVIWRSRDNQELRLYSTTIPTSHRMVTLLHDPQYRVALAWQNVAYNQPPHPSFYLGDEAPLPPAPKVQVRE